jgi:hypothetical protein
MYCKYLNFTGHAIQQMFQRKITKNDVRKVVNHGEVILEYPDDKPFPSMLILGFIKKKPVHVVFAYDSLSETGYVITAYVPDSKLWEEDFKRRR